MKARARFILLLLWLAGAALVLGMAVEPQLAPVFQDKDHQFTGVAISKKGRMFVNYPRWESPHQLDLTEVSADGRQKPYPNLGWNSWDRGDSGSNRWVCVQAVWVDDQDNLWVVDPASPQMEGVQGDGAKLVEIELTNDQVRAVYNLTDVVGRHSYLNDVRVDTATRTAYLTESQNGGIVVVDLASGQARLVLKGTDFVRADNQRAVMIDGTALNRNGKPFVGQSDGIALSPDRQWLYFKPLSDVKLCRVRTADLRNPNLGESDLEKRTYDLGNKFSASDGLIFDKQGNLYLSDMENDAIMRVTPGPNAELKVVVHDKEKLIWPDTFSWFPDGSLCVSCSQIQNMAWCHNGKSTRTTPYTIYKLKVTEVAARASLRSLGENHPRNAN